MLVPRRLIAGVLMLVAVTGVAACGGSSNGPQPLPPLTASDSPAPSPSASTPTSKSAELAAAKQVVQRYFAAKNALAVRMDANGLAELETQSCECRRFVRSVRTVAARTERFFGQSKIRTMSAEVNNPAQVQVLVTYDTSPGGTKSATGRVLFRGPARRGITAAFTVERHANRWLIADIATIDSGRTL